MSKTAHQSQNDDILDVVSPEIIQTLKAFLEDEDFSSMSELISSLAPVDLAVLIERLNNRERARFIELMAQNIDPNVLLELSDHVQEEFIRHVGLTRLVEWLPELDSDDAFSLIEHLSDDDQEKVLASIPASSRASIEKILTYPEGTAARLMQQEVATIPSFWKVDDVIKYVREKREDLPENFYEIFVVNPRHRPIGGVPLSTLLKAPAGKRIRDVMVTDLKTIPVTMDRQEVAYIFKHYDLVSAPVVDETGRIVGMITADDVADVIEEEAEKDIMQLAGVGDTDINVPFFATSCRRVAWLGVTLINALLSAFVIDQYIQTIENNGVLAALMTIVASMGGASGTQVVAIMVRGFATRIYDPNEPMKPLVREALIGVFNSVVFAIIMAAVVLIWVKNPVFAIILPLALIFNMLWSAVAGVMLPILVERMGLDPAVSAAPLLSATTDILGYASFLGLATLFL